MDTVKDVMSKGRMRMWAPFIINLTLVVAVVIGAIYTGIFLNTGMMIEFQLYSRASAIFNSIALARKWNADYGGVCVEKTPGMRSDPQTEYAELRGSDGKIYTKKNHALMTREMSDLAEGDDELHFHFRITGLGKLLDPNNAPDAWERRALESFAKNIPDVFGHEHEDGSSWYRYMAPLASKWPVNSATFARDPSRTRSSAASAFVSTSTKSKRLRQSTARSPSGSFF